MAGARTFLIVDDTEDTRVLTGILLQKAFPGARIVGTDQLDDALRVAHEIHPDGIITDHHMGTGEGDGFVRRLAEAGLKCPVVMVTSSSDPAVQRRAYDAGAAHVFAGRDFDFVGYFQRYFAREPI